MRKGLICLLLFITSGTVSWAQSFSDALDPATEITWLGLDFTVTKVIGDQEAWVEKTPAEMFQAWNELLITEKEKYDVAKALHREAVNYALDVTMEHNAAINVVDLFADEPSPEFELTSGNVQSIVNTYNFKGNKGVGFMLITESFNKKSTKASYWVTFVNMNTKKVLYTQKMTDSATGFGLRNYWASTVYGTLKKIGSIEYKKWQKAVIPVK